MDYNSALLILRLVSEAIGALKAIDDLIKRVEAGEVIELEEIEKAQADVKDAVDRWKKADEKPKDVATS